MTGTWRWRTTLVAIFVGLTTVGCGTQPPVPTSPPPQTPSPSPTPSTSRTPTIDELIALYEAHGLDCEAGEYAENDLYGGMAVVACDGLVGEAELLVEARYGFDDQFDLATYQVLWADYPNGEPVIPERDLEEALRIVVSIPYPAPNAELAESRLIGALDDPDCVGEQCIFEFNGGHWMFQGRGEAGWLTMLVMDLPHSSIEHETAWNIVLTE